MTNMMEHLFMNNPLDDREENVSLESIQEERQLQGFDNDKKIPWCSCWGNGCF